MEDTRGKGAVRARDGLLGTRSAGEVDATDLHAGFILSLVVPPLLAPTPMQVVRMATSNAAEDDLRAQEFYNVTVEISFHFDPETDEPHIYRHDVTEGEVEEVLSRPGEDRPGRERSRVVIGQTRSGRHLRVIYVPDPEPSSVFVITAYELRGRPLIAYRRRKRARSKR